MDDRQRVEWDESTPTEADSEAASEALSAAAEIVLAPTDEYPRINLRSQGEPWEKRRLAGKSLRMAVPHAAHGEWAPPEDRPDPIALIEKANEGRQKNLVPLRVGRMAKSPFAFLRGAAHVMAWDLSRTKSIDINVVIDGDAHLANFGLFGTPQHDIVLDLNDFDEVTIGPWEWDLKRLLASLAVAGREQGVGKGERRQALLAAASGYRLSMHGLAACGPLDVWHRATRADSLDFSGIKIDAQSKAVVERAVAKARKRNNAAMLEQVAERRTDGAWRFREAPPILTAVSDHVREKVITALEHYAESLPRERRFMLSRYHVVDVVHRVVGVGSVGTRAYLALLFGNSDEDALFLQIKEAVRPAHAPYLPRLPEPYRSHEGERVVHGQRLLQAVGDPLLGWTSIGSRPFYVRQMRNLKGGVPVSLLRGQPFLYFARTYGALLARAHARTGDAAAISGYCGGPNNSRLDDALADWAEAYADQTERDHAALLAAIESGRLEAETEADA